MIRLDGIVMEPQALPVAQASPELSASNAAAGAVADAPSCEVWSDSPRGHGPDLRRFAVAVWLLVRDERDLNVDRASVAGRRSVEKRSELRLGQVLKPLGEKRQTVKRCGEVCDRRRGVGRLGGKRVRDPHRARIVNTALAVALAVRPPSLSSTEPPERGLSLAEPGSDLVLLSEEIPPGIPSGLMET